MKLSALKHLLAVPVLPLGINGVRVLDVGTGPAPSLYAIDDFYKSLDEFARAKDVPSLQLPGPELNCIESSREMVHFFHHFSEFCGRKSGPFGPVFSNFVGLNLSNARAWHRRQNEVITSWDPDTNQYEEIYDPAEVNESDRLFRYRIVVFSNFLTLESQVDNFQTELLGLFQDLHPGAVVLVLGATGDSYQQIYDRIAALALGAGLKEAHWHRDTLGRIDTQDARRIKESQHRVYQYLERTAGVSALEKSKDWPDYWNPAPSRKARPGFALRVFRRGRWPKR